TVCIHMKADRRRKTFQQSAFGFVGGVWLTIDDQTQDAVFTAEHFIGLDLFIDPFRNGRLWRTNNYQVARLTECDLDLAAEVGGARQFISIAKNGEQSFRNFVALARAADELSRNAVGLERFVQPLGPFFILMAVADKGPILIAFARFGLSRCFSLVAHLRFNRFDVATREDVPGPFR